MVFPLPATTGILFKLSTVSNLTEVLTDKSCFPTPVLPAGYVKSALLIAWLMEFMVRWYWFIFSGIRRTLM